MVSGVPDSRAGGLWCCTSVCGSVQHQGHFEVLKRFRIVPKPGVQVLVDLRCLFALDLISTQSCPAFIPCRTSQNVGSVCPCCNVEQHSKSCPCGPVLTSQTQRLKPSSTHSVAVAKVGPVYFATTSSTRWLPVSH